MYVNSECSGESAHLCRLVLAFADRQCDRYHKNLVLAHLFLERFRTPLFALSVFQHARYQWVQLEDCHWVGCFTAPRMKLVYLRGQCSSLVSLLSTEQLLSLFIIKMLIISYDTCTYEERLKKTYVPGLRSWKSFIQPARLQKSVWSLKFSL